MKKILLLCLSAAVLLSACVKKKDTVTGDAHVRFVNAVPNSIAQDVYVNGALKNTGLFFGAATSYNTYTAGVNLLGFTNTGTTVANLAYSYASAIGDYATVYLFRDFTGALVSGGIRDDLSAPPAGKARVRFVNLHNHLDNALKISVTGGADLFTYLVFGTASPYYDVAPGTTFTPFAIGVTTEPVIDLNLQAGKNYTVWLYGNANTEIYSNSFIQN
jgi:hypothetical protein